jgi:transposase-like protein
MAITINGSDGISDLRSTTDGSASTPAIRGTDTNTGIFFPAADTIAFAEGGAEVARIDNAGNVCVGTTTALATASGRGNVTLNGSSGAILAFGTGGSLRSYIFQDSSTMYLNNSSNGSMNFDVNGSERMRIDSSGNLLVGTTSANGRLTVSSASSDAVISTFANTSGSPYGLLTDFTSDPNNSTNYGYRFRLTNNTNIYTIFSNGTTSARSDERFKKDIETTRYGYAEDLSKLRVVKYRWHNAVESSPKELGFIAQEVEAVFPNMISTEMNDDGIDVKSIKTSVFIPMLVKAIQEQQAIITEQANAITALEARLTALEQA